ncbi:MAG: hypothetical protein IJ221_08180 [Oscillibacter sp.]|nr:hypothetical protein [Oscillibacter sp.]
MLPFDHKNGSAAARLIAVLAIAGVLSTSALTALAAVIDEAPDAPAVLLEEGEALDAEETPAEETATPVEEADSSEGEAVPAEETEAPEEAPDADSPDAPTEEEEPAAPAEPEPSEETPEGEGAESVPEEGIPAQPPVPTVSAEAVPVPPEELPEDLAPLFIQISPALIEAAAEEFQTLTPEQTERYKSLWAENRSVYVTMPQMIANYKEIGGLSYQAMLIMYMANAYDCLNYVNAHYAGDPTNLEELNELFAVCYNLGSTLILRQESDLSTVFEAYMKGIDKLNRIKEREHLTAEGEEQLSELFCAYGEESSIVDAEIFFERMEVIAEQGATGEL